MKLKPSNLNSHWLYILALLILACLPSVGLAVGFSASVSPPRFELKSKPGTIIREVVSIENTDELPAAFAIRTADWDLAEDGGVTIHPPELQENSCRHWIRLERPIVRLSSQGHKRYRFEVHVPNNAEDGECRFAILIEAHDTKPVMAKARDIQIPVQGRIAIIVYVGIGEAKPQLSLQALKLDTVNGQLTPVAVLQNTGNAHGRPDGFLEGTDAAGQKIDFSISTTPIMPGQTRPVPIWQIRAEGESAANFSLPLRLKGLIEWETGKYRVDTVLDQPVHKLVPDNSN